MEFRKEALALADRNPNGTLNQASFDYHYDQLIIKHMKSTHPTYYAWTKEYAYSYGETGVNKLLIDGYHEQHNLDNYIKVCESYRPAYVLGCDEVESSEY